MKPINISGARSLGHRLLEGRFTGQTLMPFILPDAPKTIPAMDRLPVGK